MTILDCPSCGDDELCEVVDLGCAPASIGSLWDDADTARAVPSGRMDLVCCPRCGHTWNRAFDPALIDYDADYEASLHFSPLFQAYAEQLAERLVEQHDLRGKHVLEIGSGKGEFLALLCDVGGNHGTGYDPTYTGRSDRPDVEFVQEYFPVGEVPKERFDLLVCRHVLEHLENPAMFLQGLAASARASGGTPVFYFEVPSAAFNFGPAGLWDCIYPHISYFCSASLRHLLERSGFEILRLEETYHDQFLAVEAVATEMVFDRRIDEDIAMHLAVLASFAKRYRAAVTEWCSRLAVHVTAGSRVALWGAGSKGMVFLNAIDEAERVSSVIDLNPAKWGRHLPGTGHRVEAPEWLGREGVDQILVTNRAYVEEITQQLVELGLDAEVVLV